MPSHKVEVFKSYLGEKWENVYLVDAPTSAQASVYGVELANMERRFHLTFIQFDYVRASTLAEGDDDYVIVPLGSFGQREATANPLPLFVTLRVDVGVSGGGRPSRKYYRGVLEENLINYNAVDGTLRSSIAAVIQEVITGSETWPAVPLVDPDNQHWALPVVNPAPQMRQLRRGRRRKPAAASA